MSWVRVVLATAAAMLAIVVENGIAGNQVRPIGTLGIALALMVAWSFAISGLIAWLMRPDNPIGPAMVATSFLWSISQLAKSQDPLLYTVGTLLELPYLGTVMFALLAFPTGRLDGTFVRGLGVVILILTGPFEPLHELLHVATSPTCAGCPQLLIHIADVPAFASVLHVGHEIAGVITAAALVVLLVWRWRRATHAMRFAIRPVLWAGAVMSAVVSIWVANDFLGRPWNIEPAMDLVLVAFAFSFLVGVARTHLARSAIADLMVELSTGLAPDALRGALARALHDPSLAIAYWLPDQDRFVDADGVEVALPADRDGRIVTMIERSGRRIAALIDDPAVDDEPLMRSVCAAAGLALDNARLQAELKAQLAEVRSSRARIVEAAASERRRIERDLHDGTQQRLVSIAMTLGLAETRAASDGAAARELIAESRAAMSAALTELRALSQGIHPGILTERGLPPALNDLVTRLRMPVELDVSLDERLPTPVETTAYYVVSEGLTNIAKYAHATTARVRVARENGHANVEISDDGAGGADVRKGSGLRGLRDRVEALGGTFVVTSPRGHGTTIRAELPCG